MTDNKLLMKILLYLSEKPFNLIRDWREKSDKLINKKFFNLNIILKRTINNCY